MSVDLSEYLQIQKYISL